MDSRQSRTAEQGTEEKKHEERKHGGGVSKARRAVELAMLLFFLFLGAAISWQLFENMMPYEKKLAWKMETA